MQVVNEKGFVLLLHDECFLNTYEYSTSMEPERNRDPEAFSLYGEPLFRSPLRPERKEQQEEEYRDALEEYRNRHRGHRFITIRRFDLAQADFEKAAQLLEQYNESEDGLPFNVWYHLGLTYYLQGKFEKALYAYKKCLVASYNDDRLVATSHWLYMTLRRLERSDEAKTVLEDIIEEMDIQENQFYYEALMMYKGLKSTDELLEKAMSQGVLGMITSGYGLGCWYLYNGDTMKAREVYKNILDTGSWGAFGYIAAEADMYRLDSKPFPME